MKDEDILGLSYLTLQPDILKHAEHIPTNRAVSLPLFLLRITSHYISKERFHLR